MSHQAPPFTAAEWLQLSDLVGRYIGTEADAQLVRKFKAFAQTQEAQMSHQTPERIDRTQAIKAERA